ncbi:MAG: CPBP family intramembrane metalloprotease [Methylococcales bacterium]|jgi:membrane protease YdiL (CAAX protease family)|nr:CPBP family intramembrane metalloprotease [Methylococcales bacterium]MBT4765381.1 CPBP family intramembrane metalloprotease [Methylococcales bacterium]
MASSINTENFFKQACIFEGSLIGLALVLGWLADINPFASLYFSETAFLHGIIATLPIFIIFLALYQLNIKSLTKIKTLLLDMLGPVLLRYHWTDLLILAAIAGISEEILFRGVIQPWMESSWGMLTGLIVSSVLFGLVHAVTLLYFLLATLMSAYLGLLLDIEASRNLLIPIVTHGFYDFLAFLVIARSYRHQQKNDY